MAKNTNHYTKNGKLFKGSFHKMNNGKLHTGKTHTASSKQLFHYNQLSQKAKKIALG